MLPLFDSSLLVDFFAVGTISREEEKAPRETNWAHLKCFENQAVWMMEMENSGMSMFDYQADLQPIKKSRRPSSIRLTRIRSGVVVCFLRRS